MVSPRPSCMSWGSSTTEVPPNSCMATSKDTRVLVEGFSKIMARTAPSPTPGPLGAFRSLRFLFMASAPLRIARKVLASNASMSRKCLGGMEGNLLGSGGRRDFGQSGASGFELLGRDLDLGLADDERRQEAHDVITGLNGEHLLGTQSLEQLLV